MSMEADYYSIVMHFLETNNNNDSDYDFRKPYLKLSLAGIYPVFIVLYALVFVFGLAGNLAVCVNIFRRRLYKNNTFLLVANLALSDACKAGIILPVTLINMLLQNWIFGSFLCYVLPMVHYLPLHGSMLTFLTIAVDRYRLIVYPMKSRLPVGLCIIAVWILSLMVVLPFPVYIKFLNFGEIIGEQFDGQGLCVLRRDQEIEKYNRAIFVIMYCVPLLAVTTCFIKISMELASSADAPSSVSRVNEEDENNERNTNRMVSLDSRVTWSSQDETRINPSGSRRNLPKEPLNGAGNDGSRSHGDSTDDEDDEVDIYQENRSQKFIIAMLLVFSICWFPINILTLISEVVDENDDNAGHYDITYLTLTFIGFLSTCISPVVYALWRMPESLRKTILRHLRWKKPRGSTTSKQPILASLNNKDGNYSDKNDPSKVLMQL